MVFRKIVVFSLSFFLFSCAQLGQLSGGDKDITAPIPLKIVPPTKQVFFKEQSIQITFDEYFVLNNPQQTIVLVTKHATIDAHYSKKTLHLTLDGQLQTNTTYVLYLDGTIKDLSEGNDSLLTYVFSTGSSLVSLACQFAVCDAWSCKPIEHVTVGLFDSLNQTKPVYFAKTNSMGVASLAYLKKGKYYVKAFQDLNKDLTWQANEKLGFQDSILLLDKLRSDTIPLKLSLMPEKKQPTKISFVPPGGFMIKTSYNVDSTAIVLNGNQLTTDQVKRIDVDSLQVFADVQAYTDAQFIFNSGTLKDTVICRVATKEKNSEIQLIPVFKNGQIGPHEPCSFKVYDKIQAMDFSKIRVIDPLDSLNQIPVTLDYLLNEFTLHFDRNNYKDLTIQMDQGAVTTINQKTTASFKQAISLKSAKNYGIIHVNLEAFQGNLIVDLMQSSVLVNQIRVQQVKTIDFLNVLPGEYHFRVIQDENSNGKWDSGNIDVFVQPENVYLFSTPLTVRANWELNVNLAPASTN